MKPGKLIVIDGGDGAGKRTQTKLLVDHLQNDGHEVAALEFPQYEQNTFGQLIGQCLAGDRGDFLALDPRIASTLYAADRFESRATIEAWLEAGKVVVIDRYVSSNMLHQGGKLRDEQERTEFLAWLDHVEHMVFGMPRPDLIIYCALDPKKRMELLETEAQQTTIATDMAEKDLQHQQHAEQMAQQLVATMNNWQTIECMANESLRTPENIHEEIYAIVKDIL